MGTVVHGGGVEIGVMGGTFGVALWEQQCLGGGTLGFWGGGDICGGPMGTAVPGGGVIAVMGWGDI